jgi:hypothetical protein
MNGFENITGNESQLVYHFLRDSRMIEYHFEAGREID